jgi:hypothetical protein
LVAAAAVGFAVVQGCIAELDHEVACGDAYIDREAGEQCDPADPAESHKSACIGTDNPNAEAHCDPITCIIDRSGCDPPCGNGILDEGEECDVGQTGGFVSARTCVGLPGPYVDDPYTSGATSRCLSDCTLDRRDCGYCGNGFADDPQEIAMSELQFGVLSRAEVCDGEHKPLSELDAVPLCQQPEEPDLTANVDCAPDCLGFVPRPPDQPPCCLHAGADCPEPGNDPRCCHEFDHPQEAKHCANPIASPGSTTGDGGQKCL